MIIDRWRLMKSAPRDGTSFLAWCDADEARESARWAVCYYSIDGALCYDAAGGFCADDSDEDFRPTHWAPLPAPPLERKP